MKSVLMGATALVLVASTATAELPDQVSYSCSGLTCLVSRPEQGRMRVNCNEMKFQLNVEPRANFPESIDAAQERLDKRCRDIAERMEAREKNGPKLEKVLDDTYAKLVKESD